MARYSKRKRGGFRRKKRGLRWPKVKRVVVIQRRGGSNL